MLKYESRGGATAQQRSGNYGLVRFRGAALVQLWMLLPIGLQMCSDVCKEKKATGIIFFDLEKTY